MRFLDNPPRHLFFTGKGGVGKTSIACATAVVLARRGMGTSYHLSVVVDDAAQGITLVTRGKDLFDATYIHALLQALLDLPQPDYLHHRLIRDDSGRRLAKRDDARALALYRAEGRSPDDIRQMIGLDSSTSAPSRRPSARTSGSKAGSGR